MDLKIFSRIDEIVDYYEGTKDNFERIALEIQYVINKLVCQKSMYTISVGYRIKEAESVREKMIKNSYYRIFSSNEETLANLQDIIGLRIECKFIDDEAYVYSLISSVFKNTDDNIYYYADEYEFVRLKLSEKQPAKQKNGFDIYKIDGRYEKDDVKVNFELQIKSLVNTFWGDIEHKIIYKNNSYVVLDDLVLDNMVSIKENLNLIDRQLHQLYGRYKRDDNSHVRHRKKSIDTMMSKMIHDTVANKMRNSLGFVTDFKKSCDAIVSYVLMSSNAVDMEDYGKVLLDVLYVTNQISQEDLHFDSFIELEEDPDFNNDVFCDTVYATIKKLINVDFQWHLFFLILFEINRGDKTDEISNFIRFYKGTFIVNTSMNMLASKFGEEKAAEIKKDLIEEIGYIFRRCANVRLVWKNGMAALQSALSRTIEEMVLDFDFEWPMLKGKYLSMLNKFFENAR